MQDTSQIAKSGPGRGRVREPEDGNLLWRLYLELGTTRRRQFVAGLQAVGATMTQFNRDSQAHRKLGLLPMQRAAFYQEFFGADYAWQDDASEQSAQPATAPDA